MNEIFRKPIRSLSPGLLLILAATITAGLNQVTASSAQALSIRHLGDSKSVVVARAQPHPGLFAVRSDAFPSGSHMVRAGIESNRQLLSDQSLHFGLPPTAVGRLTGYYMDAVEGDPADEKHAYTSYLVSIFRSAHCARTAFELRWDTWFAATYYTTPLSAPVALQGKGEQAMFRTLDSNQPLLSELLLRRGAILVEIFQGTVGPTTTNNEVQSFWAIATELNKLARQHPLGV